MTCNFVFHCLVRMAYPVLIVSLVELLNLNWLVYSDDTATGPIYTHYTQLVTLQIHAYEKQRNEYDDA